MRTAFYFLGTIMATTIVEVVRASLFS